MDVVESHRCARLRSSRECDAEEHGPRVGHQANREVQEQKKGSKDQEENISIILDSKSCPSALLRDPCARAHGRSQT